MNWTMDKDRYNEKTWRTQMAEDLSAEFVKWLIANGHADEAQKIGTGPDDFQMMACLVAGSETVDLDLAVGGRSGVVELEPSPQAPHPEQPPPCEREAAFEV